MWFDIASTVIFDPFYYTFCWLSKIVIWTVFCWTLHLIYYIVLIFKLCSIFCFKELLNRFPVKAVCTLTFFGRILLTYLFIKLTICIPFSPWYGRANMWFLVLVFSSCFTWISFSDGVISLISLKSFVITQCG